MKNLKKLFLFAAFITISLGASAQLQLGVKGGLNYSNVMGFTYQNKKFPQFKFDGLRYKPSYNAGLLVRYMMSDFGIESGAYYSVLGGTRTLHDGNMDLEVEADPAYLQVPLLFLYKFKVSKSLYFYPTVGVYFGYGLGGKLTETNSFQSQYSSERDYFDDQTRKFDMGASGGLNLEYHKFIFGVGYDYGFITVNKKKVDKKSNPNATNLHNSNFKASIGYIF